MMLEDLIQGLPIAAARGKPARLRICDLTDDSRTVVPGSLFVARQGTQADGRAFMGQAAASGAVAILCDDPSLGADLPAGCALLTTDNVPVIAGVLAERMHGNPSQKLRLIGITGTNGKSTVAHIVHRMLNAMGVRCGLIGTIEVDDGRERVPASMTTPGQIELSRTLESMVEAGCEAAVMEVSSHALHQHRADALVFDVGVFTNLTGDHLDYHKTTEAYTASKRRLFELVAARDGVSVINLDDPTGEQMSVGSVRGCTLVSQESQQNAGAAWSVEVRSEDARGMKVAIKGPGVEVVKRVELIGPHNAMNTLQAFAAVHEITEGADKADRIARALTLVGPPAGRLERVTDESDDISVFVDFAHTDDALASALRAARRVVPDGAALWVVFGCGGDKDTTKRPRMGAVAAKGADRIVVTSDNPRTESPSRIIADIMEGIKESARERVTIHASRPHAIAETIASAVAGDLIVIAGRGHETEQIISDGAKGTKRIHLDDREVARDELARRRTSGARSKGNFHPDSFTQGARP